MSTEIIAALIAALVAVISAVATIYGQFRIAHLQKEMAEEQDTRLQQSRSRALIAKYRDPLIWSAFDLQSRFYNIIMQNFLNVYSSKNEPTRQYCLENTLYVIAEYLGWVEILRREVQFLDFGRLEDNQKLSQLINTVKGVFSTDQLPFVFRLFNGQQRAIGELMMVPRTQDNHATGYECIGYATFSQKLHNDEQFKAWFSNLQYDFECLVKEGPKYYQRLIELQHALLDIIDFLDPEKVRIPADQREKISPSLFHTLRE